jgi:mRNA-degrading endonuclease toxin of MazEF toxin-antitoxin module
VCAAPHTLGMPKVTRRAAYAKCEDVKSVSEQRLIGRLGAVGDEVIFQATRALRFLLDL